MRNVASTLVNLFTDDALLFKTSKSVYNELTGVDVVTVTSVSVKASPPYAFEEKYFAGDSTLLRSDLKVILASLDVEAAGLTFDPEDATERFCTRKGKTYRVIVVRPINSGDEEAAVVLALRR
jgi:hypothetical protein